MEEYEKIWKNARELVRILENPAESGKIWETPKECDAKIKGLKESE